ncbi:MAG: hypothetical protein HYU64_00450 [Armatimonadetes bacterium]|nr:hypothetical protein [Armatimonadota bacterium]
MPPRTTDLLGLALSLLLLNAGCGFISKHLLWPCAYKIKSVAPSPSNRYTAVVFVSDCGATSPFITMVSLLEGRYARPSKTSGPVYVTKPGGAAPKKDPNWIEQPPGGTVVYCVKGGQEIEAVWINDSEVLVKGYVETSYQRGYVYCRRHRHNDLRIRYDTRFYCYPQMQKWQAVPK